MKSLRDERAPKSRFGLMWTMLILIVRLTLRILLDWSRHIRCAVVTSISCDCFMGDVRHGIGVFFCAFGFGTSTGSVRRVHFRPRTLLVLEPLHHMLARRHDRPRLLDWHARPGSQPQCTPVDVDPVHRESAHHFLHTWLLPKRALGGPFEVKVASVLNDLVRQDHEVLHESMELAHVFLMLCLCSRF